MPDFNHLKSNFCNDIALYSKVLALMAVSLFLASAAQAQPARPVKVVASFTILADLTRAIAKDRALVTSLVGANGDAHVYRATPADAKALKDADLVIVNGLGFDGFMPRLVKSSGTKAAVITTSSGVKPLERPENGQSHGRIDPHAWQSVEAAKLYTVNIRDGLIKVDPAGAETYRKNAESYLAELSILKTDLEDQFAAIPRAKRVIVTSHDALAYFGREFGFTLEAVQGVSTESEPSAKDVARIIRVARTTKARAIFVENMSSPGIAEQIARESGAKLGGTLFSDALSDEKGPASTYIAMMRHNAKMLVEALKE